MERTLSVSGLLQIIIRTTVSHVRDYRFYFLVPRLSFLFSSLSSSPFVYLFIAGVARAWSQRIRRHGQDDCRSKQCRRRSRAHGLQE